jgi:exopolysaccharide production protein ExoQ
VAIKHTASQPMREAPKSVRAARAALSAAASRLVSPAFRNTTGHYFLGALLIFFWFIFYQNLPENLNGMQLKPFSTQGAIDRFIKIGTLAISFAVLANRWQVSRMLLKDVNPGLVAIMVLIPMSAMWSIDSNATVLRYVTLLGMVLLCLAITLAGWDRRRLQDVVIPPMMAILVISLMIGAVSPETVKEIGDDISLHNSWKGITFQKNQFGVTSSMVAILCLHRLLAPGKHSVRTIAGFGIALLCLFLSRSSTSLMATILASFFMVLMLRVPIVKQRFSTVVVIGIFTTIIIYALAVQNLIPGVGKLVAPIMKLTGKDMTFSARSVIWEIVKQHSAAAPWFGTGYAAYWTSETPSSASYIFVYVMSFWPSSSHNGYLEIMNDLGRAGLLCLVAFLIYYVRHALRLMPFDRGQAVLYLALLFQQMIDNLAESEWFSRTATCAVLLLASACLSRALVEQRVSMQPTAAGGRRNAPR